MNPVTTGTRPRRSIGRRRPDPRVAPPASQVAARGGRRHEHRRASTGRRAPPPKASPRGAAPRAARRTRMRSVMRATARGGAQRPRGRDDSPSGFASKATVAPWLWRGGGRLLVRAEGPRRFLRRADSAGLASRAAPRSWQSRPHRGGDGHYRLRREAAREGRRHGGSARVAERGSPNLWTETCGLIEAQWYSPAPSRYDPDPMIRRRSPTR